MLGEHVAPAGLRRAAAPDGVGVGAAFAEAAREAPSRRAGGVPPVEGAAISEPLPRPRSWAAQPHSATPPMSAPTRATPRRVRFRRRLPRPARSSRPASRSSARPSARTGSPCSPCPSRARAAPRRSRPSRRPAWPSGRSCLRSPTRRDSESVPGTPSTLPWSSVGARYRASARPTNSASSARCTVRPVAGLAAASRPMYVGSIPTGMRRRSRGSTNVHAPMFCGSS